jgi:hypothetical protein
LRSSAAIPDFIKLLSNLIAEVIVLNGFLCRNSKNTDLLQNSALLFSKYTEHLRLRLMNLTQHAATGQF